MKKPSNNKSKKYNSVKLIEEMSELTKELCDSLRGKKNKKKIKEEMKHVKQYLKCLKEVYK